MAALAAERNTPMMADVQRAPLAYKQKASVTIYKGSLVALNGGYAAPGATAASRIAVGRAKKTTVTSTGDGSNPIGQDQPYIEIEEGTFKWANDGGDPVLAANVGGLCYITDDQTVSITATGKSVAGVVIRLDSDGVWVRTVRPGA